MDIKEIIVLGVCLIILVCIIIFIYLLIKLLSSSKRTNENEIIKINEQIIIETSKTKQIIKETYQDQLLDELKEKGYSNDKAKDISSFTIKKLLALKTDENIYPSDFIINLITLRVSEDFIFETRKDVKGYSIVENKTVDHDANHIKEYLDNLNGVKSSNQTGKKLSTYKINGKSFALLSTTKNNNYKVTFKCGTIYAKKIMELYPSKVIKAQFPHGLIWFTITDEVSLELTKSLIEISYTIAKAGY